MDKIDRFDSSNAISLPVLFLFKICEESSKKNIHIYLLIIFLSFFLLNGIFYILAYQCVCCS